MHTHQNEHTYAHSDIHTQAHADKFNTHTHTYTHNQTDRNTHSPTLGPHSNSALQKREPNSEIATLLACSWSRQSCDHCWSFNRLLRTAREKKTHTL